MSKTFRWEQEVHEYDFEASDELLQRRTLLQAFLTRVGDGRATSSEIIISESAAATEVGDFFLSHAVELYGLWTQQSTRRLRVDELYALTKAVCFGSEKLSSLQRIATDYCFSLFLSQVLENDQAGMHLITTMLLPKKTSLSLLATFKDTGRIGLESLEVEQDGEAAIITFLNGSTLHAEDNEFVRDLETAVDIVYLSDHIKTGVLRGGVVTHPKHAGRRVFSSGINLKNINDMTISYSDFLIGREMGCINKLIHGVVKSQGGLGSSIVKPWIAVVEAFAIGGGMQMALACDYVIGEEGCYVSLPAAKEGIVPGVSNLRLTTATSERFAKQVILHGRKVYAGGPDSSFIFDRVAAPAGLAVALDEAIALMTAPAVPANKKMIALSKEPLAAFRSYMQVFCQEQVIRMYAPDVREKTGEFVGATANATANQGA